MPEQRSGDTDAVSSVVHMAIQHPSTGRIGTHATPDGEIATACLTGWPDGLRPKRTLRWDRVTCVECRKAIDAGDPRVLAVRR